MIWSPMRKPALAAVGGSSDRRNSGPRQESRDRFRSRAKTRVNARLQKPIMLCRCQTAAPPSTPRGSVELRRHVLMPGHQMTMPEGASTARRARQRRYRYGQ